MAKLSILDKMRIQTLREQGLGARAIQKAYPEKHWNLSTISLICQKIDKTGSALGRKAGSGRPKSARTEANISAVEQLICSQEDQPGTSLSTREVAKAVSISEASVRNIAKVDLGLRCFKRSPVQVISEATRLKRLQRSKQLLRRLPVEKAKQIFFTDEKVFYVSPPVNSQNNRVWSGGKKRNISSQRLLAERAKFSARVMVSAGVCFGGKGQLHFVDDKAKINADYYTTKLLPKLFLDCRNTVQQNFIFQQDGAPAHSSRQAQQLISENCPAFITKDEWPPNSPDLNPLDYYVWGAMLEKYKKYQPKPTNKEQLRVALEKMWRDLPQETINKAILSFRRRLRACVKTDGGHFEHLLR